MLKPPFGAGAAYFGVSHHMGLRGQIRFFMHRDDEAMFVNLLLEDESVVLIDGPRWKKSTPETTRNLDDIKGNYCIVWSKLDTPRLRANYIPSCEDWYCSNEQATLQFLRSRGFNNLEITEGRLAVSTPDYETKSFGKDGIARLERRFRMARSFVKKHFANNAIRWVNSSAIPGFVGSDSLSKPDASVWVGPHVKNWLKGGEGRTLRQFHGGNVEAILVDNGADG